MNRNSGGQQGNSFAVLQDMKITELLFADDVDIIGCCDDKALSDTELQSHLSDDEQTNVRAVTDPVEQRQLLFRRCFQRLFLARVIGWSGPIRDLNIEHKLDTRPRLLDAPSLQFSFSSSGTTVLACASTKRRVGIDIEKSRPIHDPGGLAHRFFTPAEAATLRQLPENAQSLAFLHYWTAKEAGLKAIGKGIDAGLNSFVVSPLNGRYVVEYKYENVSKSIWNLDHLEFPGGHIVAFIHRPAAS